MTLDTVYNNISESLGKLCCTHGRYLSSVVTVRPLIR